MPGDRGWQAASLRLSNSLPVRHGREDRWLGLHTASMSWWWVEGLRAWQPVCMPPNADGAWDWWTTTRAWVGKSGAVKAPMLPPTRPAGRSDPRMRESKCYVERGFF